MGVWTFRKESFYVSNLSSQIFHITGPPFPSQQCYHKAINDMKTLLLPLGQYQKVLAKGIGQPV